VWKNEDGCEIVDAILNQWAISTINLSEVIQKAKQKGITTVRIIEGLQTEGVEIIDYTIQQAEITADLWIITKPFGLSLGDRSCLALAASLNAIAVTADRTWAYTKYESSSNQIKC
jgi:ribonuclease VapC